MSPDNGQRDELVQLLEALCEDRLTPVEAGRLEEIVLADTDARRLYLDYVDLHGTLYWDTARGVEVSVADDVDATVASPPPAPRRRLASIVPVAAAAVVLLGVGFLWRQFSDPGSATVVTDNGSRGPEVDLDAPTVPGPERVAVGPAKRVPGPVTVIQPIPDQPANTTSKPKVPSPPTPPEPNVIDPDAGSLAAIVAFADERIEAGWLDNEVKPSTKATDEEWLRRVTLDIVGHIPSAEEVIAFLKDRAPDKRAAAVDRLLDDPDYIRHWATIWTNLLIGRAEQSGVNRGMLAKFLRESFAKNRPWNEVVFELVSAEGRNDRVGATNYLLAHLNNQATPATAITARLFLGTQVQCTQCHNHPFNNWKQEQFHDLNVFFQSTRRQVLGGEGAVELLSEPANGEGFYEDRKGVLHMSRPRFLGVDLARGKNVNLRRELARRMTDGSDPRLARAVVNRIWSHFYGQGFTRPVDDMGPHNLPSHPELLDRLAAELTASRFDLKRLIRWVCHTRSYGLTSRFGDDNAIDDPAAGEPPLFSRVYVKPMTVEQLYDSLLVATHADRIGGSDWESIAENRRKWLGQFVHAFGTDENDEATTFDGTITQALMMMNGELVRAALKQQPGSYLHEIVTGRSSDADKVKQLCLSALGRFPTSAEMKAIQGMLPLRKAALSRTTGPSDQLVEGLQDVFWAYLNSSEFIVVP